VSSIPCTDNYMYVFGGCTSTNTTINDLWKLNLTTRSWVRPLPTGSYPSPKACATLVCYKDSNLVRWMDTVFLFPPPPSKFTQSIWHRKKIEL
jgi:hypothetical protein